LLSAAITTDAAIADSTSRAGSVTRPSAATLSVIEWASVKAVTTLAISKKASLKPPTGCQLPARRHSTAGNSSETRNRM
jgi:hypothetical protein